MEEFERFRSSMTRGLESQCELLKRHLQKTEDEVKHLRAKALQCEELERQNAQLREELDAVATAQAKQVPMSTDARAPGQGSVAGRKLSEPLPQSLEQLLFASPELRNYLERRALDYTKLRAAHVRLLEKTREYRGTLNRWQRNANHLRAPCGEIVQVVSCASDKGTTFTNSSCNQSRLGPVTATAQHISASASLQDRDQNVTDNVSISSKAHILLSTAVALYEEPHDSSSSAIRSRATSAVASECNVQLNADEAGKENRNVLTKQLLNPERQDQLKIRGLTTTISSQLDTEARQNVDLNKPFREASAQGASSRDYKSPECASALLAGKRIPRSFGERSQPQQISFDGRQKRSYLDTGINGVMGLAPQDFQSHRTQRAIDSLETARETFFVSDQLRQRQDEVEKQPEYSTAGDNTKRRRINKGQSNQGASLSLTGLRKQSLGFMVASSPHKGSTGQCLIDQVHPNTPRAQLLQTSQPRPLRTGMEGSELEQSGRARPLQDKQISPLRTSTEAISLSKNGFNGHKDTEPSQYIETSQQSVSRELKPPVYAVHERQDTACRSTLEAAECLDILKTMISEGEAFSTRTPHEEQFFTRKNIKNGCVEVHNRGINMLNVPSIAENTHVFHGNESDHPLAKQWVDERQAHGDETEAQIIDAPDKDPQTLPSLKFPALCKMSATPHKNCNAKEGNAEICSTQRESNHRSPQRPQSPPGFWRTDMPSTQEARNERTAFTKTLL